MYTYFPSEYAGQLKQLNDSINIRLDRYQAGSIGLVDP